MEEQKVSVGSQKQLWDAFKGSVRAVVPEALLQRRTEERLVMKSEMRPEERPQVKFDAQTDNANYLFSADIHSTGSRSSDRLEAFDALVFEIPSVENLNVPAYFSDRQFKRLIDKNASFERPLPVFAMDLPSAGRLAKHVNLEYALAVSSMMLETVLPLTAFLALLNSYPADILVPLGLVSLPMSSLVSKKIGRYANLEYFWFPFTGGRSASYAEKLDNSIAPALKEELGRKPNIYISSGAAHAETLTYLKHESLREKVMQINKLWHYLPFDVNYLNIIGEVTLNGRQQISLGESTYEKTGTAENYAYRYNVYRTD